MKVQLVFEEIAKDPIIFIQRAFERSIPFPPDVFTPFFLTQAKPNNDIITYGARHTNPFTRTRHRPPVYSGITRPFFE
jgi:hypothetical protein